MKPRTQASTLAPAVDRRVMAVRSALRAGEGTRTVKTEMYCEEIRVKANKFWA